MTALLKRYGFAILFFVLLVPALFTPAHPSNGIRVDYLYNLSNFNGIIPYNDVRVRVDRDRDEVYVIDRGIVQVFNKNGMEVFLFGEDPELDWIFDLTTDEKGDIFLLSFNFNDALHPKYFLIRCNYRGDLKEKLTLTGIPQGYTGFFPNYIFYSEDRFFFLSSTEMKVVVTDRKGIFLKGYDLAEILEIPEEDRPGMEISGFNLERTGNMLFTVAVLFKAFVVSSDGEVIASFGKTGSAPGKFGIAGGIVADDYGNYLVVERLRSVVMVFDNNFQFIKEFGYRGDKPGNLIRPNGLAIGNSGKLFVSQMRKRGVSVFSVHSD